MRKYRTSQKIWAVVLTLVLVLGMLPVSAIAVSADSVVRQADPSTMNEYQELFLDPDTIGVELSTENAGGIWTDKSVFSAGSIPAELTGATSEENTQISVTDTGDNFLVALSAIASNKEIVGYSTTPTDTMFVLDLSGSMGMSTTPGYTRTRQGNQYRYDAVTHYDHTMVAAMIEAANKAIHQLLTLNNHNRVGVVLYSGNSQAAASGTDTAQLLLPLGRYDAVEVTSGGVTNYEYLEYALTQSTNTLYTQRGNRWQSLGSVTYTTAITASVKDGLKTEAGANVTDASKVTLGGTYIQNGLYKAWQEFEDADTVIADGSIQAGATRMPIMVLMSDGAPTTATHYYTGNNGSMGTSTAGTGQSTTAGIAFLTQLTAAWTLAKMEDHYNTTGKFYTLGLDTGSDYDTSVLDPANGNSSVKSLWDTYLELGNGTMTLSDLPNTNDMNEYHSSEISKDALINEMNYVDEYFPASTAQQLINAFQSIVDEIILQSKYYPTYVEKDHDHDGYVTFTDKIGGYMEVTGVHGIVIGDTLFSGALLARGFEDGTLFGTIENPSDLGDNLVWSVKERLGITDTAVARQLLQNAYDYGQLSYTSDTEFSNYIGWYSDANGNYLDFWYEGITTAAPAGATHIIKSYGMLGQTDTAHGISAADMMYASIRVSTELDDYDNDGIASETMITWRIPASLVPTITYQVQVDTNAAGQITGIESVELENANVKPIRLLYEVALQDDITEWNISEVVNDAYRDSTANKDAGYVFYTNQWKKESGTTDTTRNTYSHFEPSVQNEWYYYTDDAIIYTDENGTAYTGSSAPSTSGTYYRAYQVYEKLETGTYRMHTHYEQISAQSLAKAEQSGSNWVIPKGTVFRFWDPFQYTKSENTTNTHTHSEYPMVVHDDSNDHYYAYDVLGNNGKLTVTPATGIKVTKTIDEVVTGASGTFTFVISGGSGEATLIRLDENGDEASRQTLTFADGKAEFTLSADETVYITGLTDGTAYTVYEKGNDSYKVSAVTVNGTAVSDKEANITAVSQAIQSAAFVNSPKGYGNLTITKEIASDHTVPTSMQSQSFDVTVNVGTDLAGQSFTVKSTDMVNGGEITTTETVAEDGTIQLTIVHGQSHQIVGLPEDTVVTVTETLSALQQDFFTVTVKTRDHSGAEQDTDNQVTIHKDANATAVLINTYAPKPTTVDLDVVGTKNFTIDQPLTEDITFTFIVQHWNGTAWEEMDTTSVTYAVGESGSKPFAFDDLLSGVTYTEATVDTYQVIERIGSVAGITYDTTTHTFTVTVTDIGGQLEAKVTGHHADSVQEFEGSFTVLPQFTNTYDTAGVTIDVVKSVTDTSANPETSKAGFSFVAVETDENWQPKESGMTKTEISDGAGEARFTATYKDPGTYYFVITEKNDGKAGWTNDDTEYRVKIVITEAENGDLTAAMEVITVIDGVASDPAAYGSSAALAFANTYDPTNAQVDLDIVPTVLKDLEGRTLNAGEFTFAVFADGNASHASTDGAILVGTNDAAGNVNFDGVLTFDQVGTYHYDIVEMSGSLGGVTYDATVYDMVVEVKDAGGKLEATYYFEDAVTNQVTFHNSYDAADAEHVISGTKQLTGRPLVNAEFQFTLTEIVSATDTTAKVGGVSLTAQSDPDNDNNGTTQFAFPAIPYTAAGEYYYLIEEVNAGSTILGVTFSTAKYVVKVTVTDPGDGQLVASHSIVSGGDSLFFVNTYVPQGTSANLHSSKQLTGRVMAEGEFSFTLTQTDSTYNTAAGTLLQTVKNDASGNIVFAALDFDTAGDYYYVVEEAAGSAGGVTYDTTKYHVHISVVDNHTGNLVATTSMVKVTTVDGVTTETHASTIVFHNIYTVDGDGEVVLEGTKVYNQTLTAGQFTFGLFDGDGNLLETVTNAADGSFAFSKLTYDETHVGQTITYLVEEILPVDEHGHELSVFEGVSYDTSVYIVEVTVTDNGEGGITVAYTVNGAADPIVFTNNYDITGHDTVVLSGTKQLTGDRTALVTGEFSFGLYNDKGELVEEVSVKADGSFTFSELTFDKDQLGAHKYTVKEIVPTTNPANGITYDTTVYEVEIHVVDNGKGGVDASYTVNGSSHNAISFTNTYEAAPVEHVLEAQKIYEKGLKGDDFTFTLTGVGVDQTKKNDASGKIVFDALTFTEAGEYTYTVKEIDQILGFINYSKEVYTVVITVKDNGKGNLVVTNVAITDSTGTADDTIVFKNVYVLDDEAQITLHGTKTLTGYRTELTAGEFSFGLYNSDGELVQQVPVNADGSFVFSALVFDETHVGKDITYTVREILPVVDGKEVTEHEGRTYDTTVYTVDVTVEDNDQGGIVVSYTVNGAAETPIAFANTYEVDPAVVQLEAVKSYNRPLSGNDFTFTLTGEGIEQTKQNDAEGKIVFDELTFSKAGTYTYTVKETDKLLGFIDYSKAEYEVVITVTDNDKGQLIPVVTVNDVKDGDMTFTNTYILDGEDSIVLEGTKVYNQTLTAGQFTFELLDESGKVLQTATNNADGKFAFAALKYTEADAGKTYTYKVKETLPVDEHGHELSVYHGITYDTTVYTVEVTVVDNGEGGIEATYTVNGGNTAIVFNNRYDITAHDTVTLTGTKVMTGDRTTVAAGEFVFGLYYADGTPVLDVYGDHIQAAADAAGNFAFPTLHYRPDHLGAHKYLIKEIIPATNPANGINYDTTVYEVEIHVVDNGKGGVEVSYTVNGSAHNQMIFTNTYEAADVKVRLEGTKSYNRPLKGDDFTFVLSGNGTEQTKKNDAEGKILFDELVFTEAGTYTYTVTETDKLLGFIDYSKAVYEVVITVTDNGVGQLVAEVTVNGDADGKIGFVNSYMLEGAASITLEGVKKYNQTLSGNDFTFELLDESGNVLQTVKNGADGKFAFAALNFTEADAGKTYTYKVEETLPVDEHGHELNVHHGITYDTTVYTVEVTVTDNGQGGIEAAYTVNGGNADIVFTNDYTVTGHDHLILTGIKYLAGDRTTVSAGEFSFELYDEAGKLVETVKNGADGTFAFSELTFHHDQLGMHKYTVKEVKPEGETNGITYDTTVYTVEVYVTDDGKGGVEVSHAVEGHGHDHLIFNNTYYAAPVAVQLEGTKTYDKGLKGEDFTFVLSGNGIEQTKKNDADGKILFDELVFTEVGTYTYTVTETDKLLGFIDYSKAVYEVVITVTDNGKGKLVAEITVNGDADGKIEFVNTYVLSGKDTVILEGTKVLTGDRTEQTAGEFAFGLYDAEGKLIEQVTNHADGSFAFDALVFDASALGKHTYTVAEIAGSDPCITYDNTVYTAEVTVVDNGVGSVEAICVINGGKIVFTNVYTEPDPVQIQINVIKNVVNKSEPGIGPEGFEFVLTCGDETAKVTSDAEGLASFRANFTLDHVGNSFEFTVTETKGRETGVTYDETVHTFTVEVVLAADGTLKTLIDGEEAKEVAVEFTNTYEAPSTPVTGDTFNMMFVITMMTVSAAGILMLLLGKKQKGGKYAR